MFMASMCNAQDKCCGKKKKSGKCNEKECCCKKAKADAPKAISFYYEEPSGMRMMRDEEGNVFTTFGEVNLKKTDEGNKLDVRRGVKTTTIFVEDSVMSRVGELATQYNMSENSDSFNDSEIFATDVGNWHCSGKLENGVKFGCSGPDFYRVSDEKKMEKYTSFSSGAVAIYNYLKSLVPKEEEQ